jgi:hypothetical protein
MTYIDKRFKSQIKKQIYSRDSGEIKKIRTYLPSGAYVDTEYAESGVEVRSQSSTNLSSEDLETFKESLAMDKLYAPELAACCSPSNSQVNECLSEFNKDAKTILNLSPKAVQ